MHQPRATRRIPGSRRPCRSATSFRPRSSRPRDLVDQARRAEAAGFHALWISDHYHPWNDEQGHSAFVWSVIGALSQATDLPSRPASPARPSASIPAIIAQAAATSAVLLDGRFNLGVGSGEALNEHILGDRWPEADVRLEMLEEAVEVIARCGRAASAATTGRTTPSRTRASTTCRRAAAILVSASAPRRSGARRASATASARPRPTRRRSTSTAPRAAEAGPRRDEGLLHGRRGRGAGHRVPPVAQRGAAGRVGPGAPHPSALRAGVRAGRARDARHAWSATSSSTSSRCASTPTRASTSSSSSRSPRAGCFLRHVAREVLRASLTPARTAVRSTRDPVVRRKSHPNRRGNDMAELDRPRREAGRGPRTGPGREGRHRQGLVAHRRARSEHGAAAHARRGRRRPSRAARTSPATSTARRPPSSTRPARRRPRPPR